MQTKIVNHESVRRLSLVLVALGLFFAFVAFGKVENLLLVSLSVLLGVLSYTVLVLAAKQGRRETRLGVRADSDGLLYLEVEDRRGSDRSLNIEKHPELVGSPSSVVESQTSRTPKSPTAVLGRKLRNYRDHKFLAQRKRCGAASENETPEYTGSSLGSSQVTDSPGAEVASENLRAVLRATLLNYLEHFIDVFSADQPVHTSIADQPPTFELQDVYWISLGRVCATVISEEVCGARLPWIFEVDVTRVADHWVIRDINTIQTD